jgi:hypothetical protein
MMEPIGLLVWVDASWGGAVEPTGWRNWPSIMIITDRWGSDVLLFRNDWKAAALLRRKEKKPAAESHGLNHQAGRANSKSGLLNS